jgi:CheY-like chemotaxis protein
MQERAIILIAEDEEDYVLLLKRAFAEAKILNPIFSVSTGQATIAYLRGEAQYSNRDEYPLPDLLLLDLKLPCFSGMEILRWLRSQPGLSRLRVVVLTSSEQLKDVNEAYRLGANSFLMKPYDFEDLVHLAKVIQEYWLHLSKCPDSFREPKKETAVVGHVATELGSDLC